MRYVIYQNESWTRCPIKVTFLAYHIWKNVPQANLKTRLKLSICLIVLFQQANLFYTCTFNEHFIFIGYTWRWESDLGTDWSEMSRQVFNGCTQVIGCGVLAVFPVCFNLPFPGSRGTQWHGNVILGRAWKRTEDEQKQHCICKLHNPL